uniref:EGF-like domain-containing protein n=1 Tax=Panagrolaimus sp. ES5 TaxID=591445 RepID=A0AC34F3J2_9BILA
MFSKILPFVLIILLSFFDFTNSILQKRWISNDNNIRKLSRVLLQCPNLHKLEDTPVRWCLNDTDIRDHKLKRATITKNSRLHISVLYENDIITCGANVSCLCGSNCSKNFYNFIFNFSYIEENEEYCAKHGLPKREKSVAGFETIICDCYYGFYGEFCEYESKSRHWMLVFFWFIIASVLVSLLLALLRQKFQARFRPTNNRLRFVDILNIDLQE